MRYKSIFQNSFTERFCYRCGRYGPEHWHHIFNASNKKRSEKYGAMIHVCYQCHEQIHRKEMDKYKQIGQKGVMDIYQMSEQDFREIFGRSYLKENDYES